MYKFIKYFLIFSFFYGNICYAVGSQYILNSDGIENEKKRSESKEIFKQSTVEVDIMQLKEISPVNNKEQVTTFSYRLPKEVYTKPNEYIYKKAFTFYSNIDPKSSDIGVNTNYPGLRGANQLIIYTPDFGLRTGTNEFGAEAVVVQNTVVKFSGADSLIPRGGFVISGHGKAKNWIQQNLILGSKIYIDPETSQITAFITPETYIFEANEKIKETANVIQYYRMIDNCYDGRKASNYLMKANDFIKKAQKHPDKAKHYLCESKEYVNLALQHAIPYKNDEFKGIWIRPKELSEKEIEKSVEHLKNSGIENIFLETYYHGKTIYPSKVLEKYAITSQRGEFNGFDPLKIWIRECHKHNIKVHIWFECFYVGNKPPRSSMKHILTVYPEWANTTKSMAEASEIACSTAEHNGYFLDPANPQVQKFIGEILTEIIENYCPDGINLDYIRYPQCAQIKSDSSTGTEWGYTKYAREEFMNLYGQDPLMLKVSDPLREKWFEYRQNKVTDFVDFARKLTKKHNIMLTTVVFTDRQRSLETKMQDWKTWSRKNLVDGFTPLLLTTDKRTAGTLIHDMQQNMSFVTKLYPGIFVMFMDASEDDLLMQIHETRKMHTNGIILFDYAHFQKKYADALNVRTFKRK